MPGDFSMINHFSSSDSRKKKWKARALRDARPKGALECGSLLPLWLTAQWPKNGFSSRLRAFSSQSASKLAHSKGFASNKKYAALGKTPALPGRKLLHQDSLIIPPFILTTRRDRFRLEGAFVKLFRFGIKNLVIKAPSLLSTMKWRFAGFYFAGICSQSPKVVRIPSF